jgi:sugar phosphate isomerase/epimerase
MKCAVSTACFYPLEIESTVQIIKNQGFSRAEVFLNTDSELSPGFISELGDRLAKSEIAVTAVHPFSSGFESFYFFTGYKKRVQDGLALYKRIFEASKALDAKYVNFHGEMNFAGTAPDITRTCEIMTRLCDLAQSCGVTLSQENVVRCRSGKPDFISELSQIMSGAPLSFTFDLKQARRAGVEPFRMIDAMGERLSHIHLSDATDENDCLLPGAGNTDLSEVISYLRKRGFGGDLTIEVYRGDYARYSEFGQAKKYIENLI